MKEFEIQVFTCRFLLIHYIFHTSTIRSDTVSCPHARGGILLLEHNCFHPCNRSPSLPLRTTPGCDRVAAARPLRSIVQSKFVLPNWTNASIQYTDTHPLHSMPFQDHTGCFFAITKECDMVLFAILHEADSRSTFLCCRPTSQRETRLPNW